MTAKNLSINHKAAKRSVAAAQAYKSSQARSLTPPIQKKPNKTGLPDQLKEGVEQQSGISLDDVTVHYNSSEPAQMNAHAYAQGNNIHVAPGQEKHLPHEAWHVVQQKQGRVKPTMKLDGITVNDDTSLEREADRMGTELAGADPKDRLQNITSSKPSTSLQLKNAHPKTIIQRALNGTHNSLIAIKEEKGFRLGKTHGTWTDLLEAVKKYEKLEAKNRPTGNRKKHQAFKKELDEGLKEIEKLARKWIKKHETTILTNKGFTDVLDSGTIKEDDENDQEYKTQLSVLSAIKNLLRRIAWERSEISVNNPITPNYSDKTKESSTDNVVGGQINKLDEMRFHDSKGFYQADAISANVKDSAAYAIGIPGFDPNWAGRSIAAGRIDSLITSRLEEISKKTEVTSLVKMNFASHSRVPEGSNDSIATTGIYLEEADGVEMRTGMLDRMNGQQNNSVAENQLSMDDPVLQRALNRLQLLDAICGQVDRHMGNLFIQQSEQDGSVQSVQGIDNDMAFGSNMDGGSNAMRVPNDKIIATDFNIESRSWRGLPPIADKQIAETILAIKPEDIAKAIKGLVSDEEITATLKRFKITQNFLKSFDKDMLIEPEQWDKQRTSLGKKQHVYNSYLGTARTEAFGNLDNIFEVEKNLTDAMESKRPTQDYHKWKKQGTVEWDFGVKQIVPDVRNLIGLGYKKNDAITKSLELARLYAERVKFPDESTCRERKELKSFSEVIKINALACAKALESARKVFYSGLGL